MAAPSPLVESKDTTLSAFGSALVAHCGRVNVLRFSKTGEYFFSGSADKSITLWNASTRERVMMYNVHGWDVADISISEDNSRFASCGREKAVMYWDIQNSLPIRRYSGHVERVNAVAFSSGESSVLVSGSYDATVRLWDTRSHSRDPMQILADAKDSISSVAVKDYIIVSGSIDGHVRIYDVRNCKVFCDKIGPPVTCVSASEDCRTILTSSLDGSIRLLDCSDGSVLRTFTGHKNSTYKVFSCFANSGKRAFSGSEDGAGYFWDIVGSKKDSLYTQKLKAEHSGIMAAVAAQPDSSLLICGGADGRIHFWQ